ncbi:hypothetical protein SFRURICE_000105 [Spodoptera frugiperda]|nr:hypothetical protein SFRURICE_000105 [Spodoptera frugiperda]
MNMETDQIDSQFIAENIGFLDNCFDNSFILQSSLQVVKEQAAETNYYQESKGNERPCKKLNNYSQNSTVTLESTQNNSQTSRIVSNRNKKLRDWGLPLEIAKKYEARGITEMFEWQVNCLANSKVLFDCCNLVYSAPTSAGKTLVAEILTIKTILERQKKVIIILPFVSIVREKMFYLQDILSSSGIRVEGFMGSQSPPGGLQAVHVAVCTIEKANSLVNKLLDDGSIAELGAIIVDELHLLGDPSRGYILELLLTKIKYVSFNSDDVKVQIVGMSATLPNLKCLANWLNAELFITQFRPIPLDEYCLVGDKYYDKKGVCVNTVDMSLTTEGDNVLKICLETIKDGCSILIFCMTKNWCESLAQSVATSFYKLGCENGEAGSILRSQLKSMSIMEVLEQLKNCPVGLDQVLKKTISFGVAYHHAGLTFDERDIVEGGFKSGAIRVLVATSTLSSGVNLPARKVIIRSPVFQRQPINILTYKQMIGRAGRMGKDLKGESILICTEAERKIGFDLMMGNLDPVTSCIESEDKYMRAVLEMIASQVLTTKEQLDMYSKCTLLYNQQEATGTQDGLLENTLDELQNYELVRVQTDGDEERFVATPLGKACLSSSMAPNDGLSLFCELQKARQCLVLETDLHLIYLVTPYSVSSQWGNIDWIHMLTLWESLTKAMKRVGELVGVQESFIIRCLRGGNKANNIQNKINIHKRFYTALALQDLVNEVPLADVAAKFQCARGFLQSLQQGAATFAGMVTAFCHQLGWKNMEMLISQFQDRLHFGIHSELLELMKLPSLNGMRARTLFDSGFESIASIASAGANTIENILHKSVPFQSEKGREDDDCDDIRKRNKIKSIWITGYCGITTKEAAENLIAEARRYLSLEIGVTEIKWDSKSSTSNFASNDNNVEISNKIDEITSPLNKSSAKIRTQSSGTQNTIKSNRAQCEQTLDKENVPLNVSTNTKPDLSICALNRSSKGNKTLSYKNKDELSKTIVNISKEINKTAENISPSLSNDIIWDSLNFTEAGLDNISKLRTSDKMFSPNISFGEIEDKPEQENMNTSDILNSSKHVSAKDISLFSSEGDNTSLFEESLPLDLISSNFLDRGSPMPQDTALHYESINSNTILNAFKTTLLENERNEDDENEDIKLIYEDDKIIEKEDQEIDSNRIAVNCHKVHPNLVAHKRRQSTNKEIQPLEKKKKIKKYCGIDFTHVLFKIANLPKKYKNLDTIESLCLRTYLLWMIAEKQEKTLEECLQPAQNVIEIENQVSKILANCEYYGITVDKDLASRLLIDVRNSQESLEKKAYKLCGYHFNFNSSKDVAKVLGIYNGRKVSTKKSVLTSHNSPLSSTVIYWRKLNSILTKTLYPLTEKACIYSEGDRINPSYTMFTCTGRISMHEPNLQNVPRTFSIPCEYLTVHSAVSDDVVEFNCRNIFKSAPGYVIVSADYCQLEMRILTHFSQDQVLMKIMNSDMDVFKAIAASWSHVSEDEVDDDLRQKAKQLCYGIIYGMGNKTLGQLLDVTEMEAAVFMDSFYKTYPAVKACTQSIIEECRERGYIETLTRRRRYLPDINSQSGAKRSAAERQAVNTTIQGSAADIAKAAMCSIDTKTDSLDPKPRLILQMHDELIYEVHETHQQYFVGIMKQVMEETVTLRVPLPVKVKTGLTWGSLKEIKFNES